MPHSVHSTPPQARTPDTNCNIEEPIPLGQKYWNNNLPEHLWTETCPEFLIGISSKNVGILSGREENWHNFSWEDCKLLVTSNTIDKFQRPPLALRRYIRYMYGLRQHYGSVMTFIQKERLGWRSLEPTSTVPFVDPSDYKILYNDWPYGIDGVVVHLVVWVKFDLPNDPDTGEVKPEYASLVTEFINRTFCSDFGVQDGVPEDDVLWFKNWDNLKSVKALEHFHVMLREASQEFLNRITNNDRPMAELVAEMPM
ncbi:hypothetical protein LTR66_015186 [Elasticomyces elasticus]|nr:hypothetical protein LTR66_015186 [Elasticomyces elasticus]